MMGYRKVAHFHAFCSSLRTPSFIALITPIVIGTDIRNVIKSASGCAIWIPHIPIRGGSIHTTGMRIIPCLAKPRIEALHIFPVVCKSILLMVIHAENTSVKQRRRSAISPISMTSGSPLRQNPTIGAAQIYSTTASARRTMDISFTQNQNPSFTRLYNPAP